MADNLHEQLKIILEKQEELKELKRLMKDIEDDVPMELEDLLESLKDLKKQAKDRKDEHIKQIMTDNNDYNEYREKVQAAKEAIAEAKLKLFTEVMNESREKGDVDLDQTVTVSGMPLRLQTQKEMTVYLNGKLLKA